MGSNKKKDANATLDFAFDWKLLTNGRTNAKSDWLASGETILSYEITAQDGITLDSDSATDDTVTVWLTGGTAGTWYTVACKITTNAGRIDERTMNIRVLDR
jgi:hypothetical protein